MRIGEPGSLSYHVDDTGYISDLDDDDRYDRCDMVLCVAAGQPKLDLSDQLRRCSVASTNAIRLSSVNVLHCYRH